MQVADLYIRVSTDEQAEKGFSQRNQEEVLRRYCELRNIRVRKAFFEDHSAKTFNRPVWKKLLVDLKRNKGIVDLLLFTKWDRFSRNAGDAYSMINMLKSCEVDPQAIEQPLDLTVPENKMMLAFYLASPEVENDRRSINVFQGIRRAKKEGRWPSMAPQGYANLIDPKGCKYIAPKEPYATIMREAFEQFGKDIYSVESVWREAKQKGLACGRNNFWNLLKNPLYCGKILVPKYKDEDEYFADGQHEPLISEALFYHVQEIMAGRKHYSTSVVAPDNLPLRGFLCCPKCTRKLTGSGSKGRNATYYYYHCENRCGVRFKAEEVNRYFERQIAKLSPMRDNVEFYAILLTQAYKAQMGEGIDVKQQLLNEIKAQHSRMDKAMDLLLKDAIEAHEYKKVKADAEKEIAKLEAQLPAASNSTRGVADLILEAMKKIADLKEAFAYQSVEVQREIFAIIYPETVTYQTGTHRTGRVNDVAVNIELINRQLTPKKNWTKSRFYSMSSEVVPTGIEPVTQGFSVLCSTI